MKKVLFATTAIAAAMVSSAALADITLYGSARLGLLYDEGEDNDLQTTSRTRFGVTMSGETDSGITFGADMRADQVVDGGIDTADDGRAGEAFVSGAFGTLSFGDTNGADEQWVGDLKGELSLTGLGEFDETAFLSNGGSYGDELVFAPNPDARPTVRYDFDFAGFGISLSADHGLSDVGVGGGYSGDFGGFAFNIGLGYYNFEGFTTETPGSIVDLDTGEIIPIVTETEVGGGEQYTAMLGFGLFGADMNVIYNKADSDGDAGFETLGVGGEYGFDAVTIGAFYRQVTNQDGDVFDTDNDNVYGISARYDLGGGAEVAGAVQSNYDDDITADFGIDMSF
jgi:outer membrane protein OmpU